MPITDDRNSLSCRDVDVLTKIDVQFPPI